MAFATILWPTLTAGIVIFMIMWWRMRAHVDPRKQGIVENILLALVFIVLCIDVGFAIKERADINAEMNDCIGFYRYFPDFHQPEANFQFSFLKRCDVYFTPEDIQTLRQSGYTWNQQHFDQFLFPQLNGSGVGNAKS